MTTFGDDIVALVVDLIDPTTGGEFAIDTTFTPATGSYDVTSGTVTGAAPDPFTIKASPTVTHETRYSDGNVVEVGNALLFVSAAADRADEIDLNTLVEQAGQAWIVVFVGRFTPDERVAAIELELRKAG